MKRTKSSDAEEGPCEEAATKKAKGDEEVWSTPVENVAVMSFRSPKGSDAVLAVDLDGTIIEPASGKKFATGANDWKLLSPDVQKKIQALVPSTQRLVIISNQLGVSKGKKTLAELKTMVGGVARRLGVPMLFIAALAEGIHRKPAMGMFDLLQDQLNDGIKIDCSKSVYVGDAAGRAAQWDGNKKTKKDFSDSDRKFAINAGLPFLTPEEFFHNKPKAPFTLSGVNPRDFSRNAPLLFPETAQLEKSTPEMIMVVGLPGSGKDTFARKHFPSYSVVNRDTLKTWQKCIKESTSLVAEGRSVAVTNTDVDVASRARYVEVARSANIPIRCFYFLPNLELSRHLNAVRMKQVAVGAAPAHDKVPDMVFYSMRNKWTVPTTAEGFSEIVRVNFVPSFGGPSAAQDEKTFNELT